MKQFSSRLTIILIRTNIRYDGKLRLLCPPLQMDGKCQPEITKQKLSSMWNKNGIQSVQRALPLVHLPFLFLGVTIFWQSIVDQRSSTQSFIYSCFTPVTVDDSLAETKTAALFIVVNTDDDQYTRFDLDDRCRLPIRLWLIGPTVSILSSS